MWAYIARRLVLLVFVLFGVSLLTFTISHLIPADPARYAAGLEATPEQVEALRRKLGLDLPPPIQYVRYITNLLRGDFGFSIATRRPVLEDLKDFLPATLELVVVAYMLTLIGGIVAGVISATSRGKLSDYLTRIPIIAGSGTPMFWLALMGQLTLYYSWDLLPYGGRIDMLAYPPPTVSGFFLIDTLLVGDFDLFRQTLIHIAMPAGVLAIGRMAIITRLTRASLLETLNEDFVRTARSKGLTERIVIYRHTLKVAFIPVLTELGLQFGWMLAGTIVVESIFAWPGIGRYAFHAIQFHDLPAIMGVTLALTLFKVLSNLLVDVFYVVIDPRIRL